MLVLLLFFLNFMLLAKIPMGQFCNCVMSSLILTLRYFFTFTYYMLQSFSPFTKDFTQRIFWCLASFIICIISCINRRLYPLISLPSSSKGLLLKKHSITILFNFLDHFVLTVVGWRSGPCCQSNEHLSDKESSPTDPGLFTLLFSEFWFETLLIKGIVNFRLYNHWYF